MTNTKGKQISIKNGKITIRGNHLVTDHESEAKLFKACGNEVVDHSEILVLKNNISDELKNMRQYSGKDYLRKTILISA